MPDPILHALLRHVDGVYAGPNGDYAAVLEALAGVTASQAAWHPAPGHNSIWQIVEHLIASREWQIEMLDKGRAAPPVWIEPSGDEAAWQATLARLAGAHVRLKAALERLSDAELMAVDPQLNQTLLELILSSGPAHDAHHSGQLDYLRGLQAG
jgi:hypothetical protein